NHSERLAVVRRPGYQQPSKRLAQRPRQAVVPHALRRHPRRELQISRESPVPRRPASRCELLVVVTGIRAQRRLATAAVRFGSAAAGGAGAGWGGCENVKNPINPSPATIAARL